MKKKYLKEQGITLVALIVTIIILLILAGISIAQLTGNSLLEKAKLAKEKSENAQIDEEEKVGEYENELDKYLSNSRVDSNKSMQFKKLGTLVGVGSETSNYLELQECNEILVSVCLGNAISCTYTSTIPYQELTSEARGYRFGHGVISGVSANQLIIVYSTSSKIWLNLAYGDNNKNLGSTTEMSVYYR